MKAKLIKVNDYYNIEDKKGNVIGTSYQFSSSVGDVLEYKLSKQNCDEIFGVVDVEKLAEESWGDKISSPYHAYIEGFNKAMELNKDKVFTLEQVLDAFYAGWISKDKTYPEAQKSYKGYLERYVMQPTEIEVKIEMGDSIGISDLYTPDNKPKLDENGCLILTKKI
jgi:hypothetical protein